MKSLHKSLITVHELEEDNMRMAQSEFGHSVMVSNEEYAVLKKIHARGKVPVLGIQEYYREVADKLVSRGVLNIIEDNGEEFYVPIRSKNEKL